jgi:hypothetical protein
MRPEHEEAIRRFAVWKHRHRQAVPDDAPQEVYADLMKNTFAPALRAAGLRGSNGRFEVPSDSHWVHLGFQKSVYSDQQELRFTINLSVIRRDEWTNQIAARPYLGKRPTPNTVYGPWADQIRIGTLTAGGDDKWWRIVRGKDVAPVADDALPDMLVGVQWLRQHSNG